MSDGPKTLLAATRYFSDPDVCREHLAERRWPNGVVCPTCGAKKVGFLASVNRYQCSKHHPKRQFTVKTGTVFEDSPLGLDKWLVAMWLLVNAKNGISSHELGRAIGVTQKTAWFVLHRIREAMKTGTFEKMGGKGGPEVEIDETFIGGKAANMHKDKKEALGMKQGTKGNKEVVMGFLERDGKIRLYHVKNTRSGTLVPLIHKNVLADTSLYSDANPSYVTLPNWYRHEIVDHAYEYVNGRVSTNGLENFWSLMKRTMRGTYVAVNAAHLSRYLDEYTFRFNARKDNDSERFQTVSGQIAGKRLTYRQLTGKV